MDDVQELAQWFADVNPKFWKARRTLLNHVNEWGPIPLPDGRSVGYQSDGNAWDSELVAQVMPQLIKHASVTFNGEQPTIERVISLVLEEVPEIEWSVERKVDAVAGNNVIRAGGPAAERLKPARVAKSKLGISNG